jgi:two-component system response regulator
MAEPVEILVVEDYEPDAQLLRLLFRRHHILNLVHVATDGVAALDFIFARGSHVERVSEPIPLVVIMDIRLPKLDGWEVLRQLREDARTRNLPVIIVSGTVFEQEAAKAESLGANACIPKPVTIDELVKAFKKCGILMSLTPEQSE